jgi:hypothetical protein
MFPSLRTSVPAQRALAALRLTRSFLMLEDDYDVDWEVDPNEPPQDAHPHRAPLRGRTLVDRRGRRTGQPAPMTHACTSPVRGPAALPPSGRRRREDRRPPLPMRTPRERQHR